MLVSKMVSDNTYCVELLDKAEQLYSSLLLGEITLKSAACSDTIAKLKEEISKSKKDMCIKSKTSQLWHNYQQMIGMARL